jgi:pimeloyl-ACP methyl ester carboxylesterase
MKRRAFVATIVAAGMSLTAPLPGFAGSDATPTTEGSEMNNIAPQTGYAPVNGLRMYYEIHGRGAPTVLLHGAYMSTGAMEPLLSDLAKTRQVIAADFQGHGRTADVDRPLTYEQMADDIAALMRYLAVTNADISGYSMGGGVALQLVMRHPALVRKVVVVSGLYRLDGLYPEVLTSIAGQTPEAMEKSPWYERYYASIAPNPGDFPTLVEKLKRLDAEDFAWPEADIRAIQAPTMLVAGDSDVIRPEHTLALFRLLGGGVPADLTGLPKARLAILPGTTHITVMTRVPWLLPMITEFLDAPLPAAERPTLAGSAA